MHFHGSLPRHSHNHSHRHSHNHSHSHSHKLGSVALLDQVSSPKLFDQSIVGCCGSIVMYRFMMEQSNRLSRAASNAAPSSAAQPTQATSPAAGDREQRLDRWRELCCRAQRAADTPDPDREILDWIKIVRRRDDPEGWTESNNWIPSRPRRYSCPANFGRPVIRYYP